jgi:hypothetical protein
VDTSQKLTRMRFQHHTGLPAHRLGNRL